MSSTAQIAANRQNAQHCTGPRTEAGKEVSKNNACRHGLTSAQVVLPNEDRAAFEELKAGFLAEYQPVGQTEEIFVSQLAETWWRCLRARRVQGEYLSRLVAAGPANGEAAIADAITAEKDNAFAKIQRYVNAADRSFKSVLRQLQDAQQIRRHIETLERFRNSPPNPSLFFAQRNGFVSQPFQQPQPSPQTPLSPDPVQAASGSKIQSSDPSRRS